MKFYLLGEKLSHSLSPEIHSFFGNYSYEKYEISRNDLPLFFKERHFDGLNITIPYKFEACKLCDVLSRNAQTTQCVNTVLNKNGTLYGYNTDIFGFSYLLRKNNINPDNKTIVIFGNGGASQAVKSVLTQYNCQIITVSRQGPITFFDTEKYKNADIAINCTPLGMYPKIDECPVDISLFKKLSWAIDLTYNPYRTVFLQDASKLGANTVNGLDMLCAQGFLASQLFNNNSNDSDLIDISRRAIEEKYTNIALIGMPGCGKTTLAKILSEKTGRPIFDLDNLILQKTKKTPEEIIRTDGECKFREIENSFCRTMCLEKGAILSCGGGTICTQENIKFLRSTCIVVFISCPLNALDISGRPLSEDGVEKLWKKRKNYYAECADIVYERDTDINILLKNIKEFFK